MYTIEDIYNDIKNGADLKRIHSKYGGHQFYIPQRMDGYKEDLKAEFNGYNFKELSYKYQLTEAYVRELVKDVDNNTPSLFEGF